MEHGVPTTNDHGQHLQRHNSVHSPRNQRHVASGSRYRDGSLHAMHGSLYLGISASLKRGRMCHGSGMRDRWRTVSKSGSKWVPRIPVASIPDSWAWYILIKVSYAVPCETYHIYKALITAYTSHGGVHICIRSPPFATKVWIHRPSNQPTYSHGRCVRNAAAGIVPGQARRARRHTTRQG